MLMVHRPAKCSVILCRGSSLSCKDIIRNKEQDYMDNWSDPFHSCCRSARHNTFALTTAITNRGAVELVDWMDVGKCLSAMEQEILLFVRFLEKYMVSLPTDWKNHLPRKLQEIGVTQYGKYFPSISPFPFCGSQKCTEQSALFPKPPSASSNPTCACEHLCAEGKQCPQTAQKSSSWAGGARPLRGCSWGLFYTGESQTNHSTTTNIHLGEIKE